MNYRPSNLKELINALICDIRFLTKGRMTITKVLPLILLSVKFQVVGGYRILVYFYDKKNVFLTRPIMRVLTFYQNTFLQCYIHPKANIATRLKLPHPTGIVIGENSIIGNNVSIFQQVTIGSHGRSGEEKSYPIIEDDVIIYSGAKIIGNVRIGKGAVIGANAVVITDIPPKSTAVGVPAKIIEKKLIN